MKLAGIENLYDRMEKMFTKPVKLFRRPNEIVIARELFRDPEILIFDEPTSSLDKHSTKIIEKP